MTDISEERKAGFIAAINYLGDIIVKTHKHATEKRAVATEDEERFIHDGVMVACEMFGKVMVDAAKEMGIDTDAPDTPDNAV